MLHENKHNEKIGRKLNIGNARQNHRRSICKNILQEWIWMAEPCSLVYRKRK
jgi:hypothetical protein